MTLTIRSKRFCDLIANRMNWDPDRSYWVEGRIYPNQKVVVYDLTSAKEIVLGTGRHKRKKSKSSASRKSS